MKIKVYFADCQQELTSAQPQIEQVAEEVAKTTSMELDLLYNLDLVVTNRMPFEIPPEESFGVVYSNRSNVIAQLSDIEASPQNVEFELLTDVYYKYRNDCNEDCPKGHCLTHALFDNGLALVYAFEHLSDISELSKMKRTIINRGKSTNLQALHKLSKQLFTSDYDHWQLFYASNVPQDEKFIGFSLGFFLAQKYLADTHQTCKEAAHNSYQQFDKWVSFLLTKTS